MLEHWPYSCEFSQRNEGQLFFSGKAASAFSLRFTLIGEMLRRDSSKIWQKCRWVSHLTGPEAVRRLEVVSPEGPAYADYPATA